MRHQFTIISLLTYSTAVLSSTFIPITLEKQMENASGVLKAEFKGVEYRKISENKIITEATFKIIESVGIKQSEIVNKNNFKVIYPGGKWQNLDYRVSGAPSFRKDEKSLLILKKTSLGYTVKGLGMGKYEIVQNDKGEFYKSSIFPNHMKLGKIPKGFFENVVINEFGSNLERVKTDKYVNIFPRKEKIKVNVRGRFPASNERVPNSLSLDHNDGDSSSNPVWIVILFSLLGAMSVYTIRRAKRFK